MPLKYMVRFSGGGTPSRDVSAYWRGDIPWVSPKDMKVAKISASEEYLTEAGLSNSTSSLIDQGALLLVVRSGILKHTIPVAINTVPVSLNQDMKALRINKLRLSVKYIQYLIVGKNKELLLEWAKQGATVESLEQEYLENSVFPVPSLQEQEKIANFLDHETAKIDTLIEKQQQLIKLLKEKRQAVISHAVTKGLNPNAPMKDSGVEWLGEVPQHWGVVRYKFICNQTIAGPFGSSITKDMYRKSGVKVYGQEQVIPANFEIGDYYIDLDSNPHLGRYKIHAGDVLISCVGTFGKVAIFPVDGELGIINPRLIKSELIEDAEPYYIAEILRSDFVLKQFESRIRGGTMGIINISVLNEIPIPMPPSSEQKVTLDYLVEKKKRFDNALERASRSQNLLKERRTALISAAVTGKIDVRNWQPPESTSTHSTDA